MSVTLTTADGASADFPHAAREFGYVKNFLATFPDAETVPLLPTAVPRALEVIHHHVTGSSAPAKVLREDPTLFGDVLITAAGLEYTKMVREWTLVFKQKYQFLASKELRDMVEKL